MRIFRFYLYVLSIAIVCILLNLWCSYLPLNAVRRPHPTLIYEGRPNVEFQFARKGEQLLYVRFNQWGFHDRERAIRKPDPQTFRIGIIGDSFVEAKEVPLELTFSSQLEKILRGQNTRAVEVINFGVGGYGSIQYLHLLRQKAVSFDLDYVIVVSYFNDVIDDIAYLLAQKYRSPGLEGAFSFCQPLFPAFDFSATRALCNEITKRRMARVVLGAEEFIRPILQCDNCPLKDAFPKTASALNEIKSLLNKQEIPWLLVLIPCTEAVIKERFPSFRDEQASILGASLDGLTPDHLINITKLQREWAIQNKVEVIDMLKPLSEEIKASETFPYLHEDSHFNARGHSLIARVLAQEFLKRARP